MNYQNILNDIGNFNNFNKISESEFIKIMPDLLFVDNERRKWHGQLLASLLSMRYGIGSYQHAHKVNECALAFNISSSRAQQCIFYGLRLLRRPKTS